MIQKVVQFQKQNQISFFFSFNPKLAREIFYGKKPVHGYCLIFFVLKKTVFKNLVIKNAKSLLRCARFVASL